MCLFFPIIASGQRWNFLKDSLITMSLHPVMHYFMYLYTNLCTFPMLLMWYLLHCWRPSKNVIISATTVAMLKGIWCVPLITSSWSRNSFLCKEHCAQDQMVPLRATPYPVKKEKEKKTKKFNFNTIQYNKIRWHKTWSLHRESCPNTWASMWGNVIPNPKVH